LIDTWDELASFGILFVSPEERVARRLLQKSDKCLCACAIAKRSILGPSSHILSKDVDDIVLSEEHVMKTDYDKYRIYQARSNVPKTRSLIYCETRILLVNLIKLAVKEGGDPCRFASFSGHVTMLYELESHARALC
jgi:hypothetical protein